MKKLSLICFAACIAPNFVLAQTAIEHHVWQDKGRCEPLSHTAQAITGPIRLSGNPAFAKLGSKMTLKFSQGKFVKLTSVGALWRVWDIASKDKVTAEIFRVDHDPGTLLHSNTICGSSENSTPIFLVFYENSEQELGVDVFKSKDSPGNIDSPGLCGTFSFSAPKP